MRLHKNLVITVVNSLKLIFIEEEYAGKVVEKALKINKKWGARDRKFIAETIYDIVRWKRLYNEIAGTKNHFTNDNLWKLVAVWAVLHDVELPEWQHFYGTPLRRIKGRFNELQKDRVFKESIPDWMDEICVKELGEKKWSKEITALNQQASVIVRTNSLKVTKIALQKEFAQLEIHTSFVPGKTHALQLDKRANVFVTDAFKKGFFEVQDASSQLVAPYLNVEPGMRVIDTCAGAGGKTLHLAALMQNKGQIIALDIYEHKLRQLKKRAKRNGAHNITTRAINSTKDIKKLYNTADRVLIDAPCSGIGVLKRNPDSKWKLKAEFLDKIKETQSEILNNYSKMLKVDGQMVYATCSILPSENELQIGKFLSENTNFELISDHKVSPAESGYDGFYMALLKRVE
ncbi:MAG: RNA methyltransferase [Flavobacteriaceae bacterium]|nr:MAG: RNA methyltransferase [Flavobacteriaceae bacterium]